MSTRTWDLPLRLFHWGLAASAVAAFLTGDELTRGRAHVVLGTLAVGLVAFRFGWGVVGEPTSRWRAFTRVHTLPAALSAVTALALVLGLALTGVLVLGGEEGRGPAAGLVSAPMGIAVHSVHRALAWAGVAWLAVHLAGVAKQSWAERRNLVRAMVDGRKGVTGPAVRLRTGVAVALVAAAPLVVALPDRAPAPLQRPVAWDRECGDCHLAFPPDLLPARSWDAMLASEDHFGEFLGLDPATADELRAWATAHGADAGETEHAVRIAATVDANALPQRITTLPWWEGIHAAVPLGDEPRTRCADCHPDAERGSFDARAAHPEDRRET
ncbi:MAG: cytochrome b/b6 domain-containing protein [Alphaproteobacteria bacterium]|nr:cytochrome b/b6 domain-containing protein [Alphaproteobacteria bacterium]